MLPAIATPRDGRVSFNEALRAFDKSLGARTQKAAPPNKKLKAPRQLEQWLELELEAHGLHTKAPCVQRLRLHKQALEQLCDMLFSYRPLLQSVLAEVDAALSQLEDWADEVQRLRGSKRKLQAQLQALAGVNQLQVEEAWSVAQRLRREMDESSQVTETSKQAQVDQDEAVKALEREKKKLHKDVKALEAQLAGEEQKRVDAEKEAQRLSVCLKLSKSRVSKLSLEVEELKASSKKQREEADADAERRTSEVAELRVSLSELQVSLSELQAKQTDTIPEEKLKVLLQSKHSSELLGDDPAQAQEEQTLGMPTPRPGNYLSENLRWRSTDDLAHLTEDTDTPTLPDGMAPEATKKMRSRQRRDPQQWTLTVDQWSSVLQCCQDQAPYQRIKREGKKYVNMYDVNSVYVKPWTRGKGCGVAVLMSGEVEAPAGLMLSHAWAEDVEECQMAVMEFVMEKSVPRSTPLWFCLFANYQASDEFGPTVQEQLALRPFASVIQSKSLKMNNGGFGLNAIHTSTADLYKRLWCVHEVERALGQEDIVVSTSMSQNYKEQTLQRLDLFLNTADGQSDWEDCLWAANVKVKTIQARCDKIEDERMLVNEILSREGGFQEIDDVIESFRRSTFGNDIRLMMKAVQRHGKALEHASVGLKLIRELVLAAVQNDGEALQFAAEEHKADRQLVLEAVQQNGHALQFAAEELHSDRDVLLGAVKQDGTALQHIKDPAAIDQEVMIAAVQQNGHALQYAPEELKKDDEVVKQAVMQDPKALEFVPEELQSFAVQAVETSLPEEKMESLHRSSFWQNFERKAQLQSEISEVKRKHSVEEKKHERVQLIIDMMKSMRPYVVDQKPKKALRLIFQGLHAAFTQCTNSSWLGYARQAIAKQFDASTEEDKHDYWDMFFDPDVGMNPSLRSALLSCLDAIHKAKMKSIGGMDGRPASSSSPSRPSKQLRALGSNVSEQPSTAQQAAAV
eukprot:TRINITY_DN77354_c0_g1_i1.p1 TRINITY_DN77354_c0_g1~~TRINITY_DN77354_c0_g1_i1.p1  ORF type:complete len:968 (+),score=273.11 TRINITY_DN77354_c0_g1_i1:87-2990(+)